jgi:predicted CoA-binding protein
MATELMQPRIARFLKGKKIALVGATNKTDKWGYKILKVLKSKGYTVFPVHPSVEAIDGDKVWKTLRDLPEKPDGVNIVVPPSATEDAVRLAKELGIDLVWMQPGAESDDAIDFCDENGMECIHHKCILVETGTR